MAGLAANSKMVGPWHNAIAFMDSAVPEAQPYIEMINLCADQDSFMLSL